MRHICHSASKCKCVLAVLLPVLLGPGRLLSHRRFDCFEATRCVRKSVSCALWLPLLPDAAHVRYQLSILLYIMCMVDGGSVIFCPKREILFGCPVTRDRYYGLHCHRPYWCALARIAWMPAHKAISNDVMVTANNGFIEK